MRSDPLRANKQASSSKIASLRKYKNLPPSVQADANVPALAMTKGKIKALVNKE
jgi:hypothetical protein